MSKQILTKIPVRLRTILVERLHSHPYFMGLDRDSFMDCVNICINLWVFIAQQQINDLKCSIKREKYHNKTPFHDWVEIHRSVLHKMFRRGRNHSYTHFLEGLKFCKLINVGDSYLAGKFPKSYGINPKIFNGHYEDFMWLAPTDLLLCGDRYKTKDECIQTYPSLKTIIETHFMTTIDMDGVQSELNALKVMGEISEDQYFFYLHKSILFDSQFFWFARKDGSSSRRFFSSFTTLPRILRKYIKIDGDPIVEVDMSCALPFFVSRMVKHQKFREDCEAGIFWDVMSESTGYPRDKTKTQFFRYVLGSKTKLLSGQMLDSLETEYPGLYDEIWLYSQSNDIFEKVFDVESRIFVDGLSQVMCGFKTIPFMTIHDCVVVRDREHDISKVKLYLEVLFRDRGLTIPKLSVKKL